MSSYELIQRLDQLLSEDLESVLYRESETLQELVGSLDNPFLLFGAGNLGRKVLKKLTGIGKLPVGFIDNNPMLWQTDLDGIPIMSPTEASKRFDPATIGIITTIWCGEATDTMSDRINSIRSLGFKNIALFGHLAWKYHDYFLPHYCLDRPSKIIQNAANIRRAFACLADDESRLLFVNHIAWRLFLDYDLLPTPACEEIYFNDRYVSHSASEVLYDIGAYTGDSVESFLRSPRGKHFAEIHSFEPSPTNFARLQRYAQSLGELSCKLHPYNLALGATSGSINVEADNGPASRVGAGHQDVPMTTIDLFSQSHRPPTFIKIDIEGFEPQCLEGAKNTIQALAPVVSVCVYHLQSHLWEILLQLHEYYSGYRYTLCPHLADGWDLVLYAVPESRLPAHQ